jgi:prepilin-type N-terminal cleavage/methylation domain-containing protein
VARSRGFSVVEVVWVIALLGVLGLAATVLVPSSLPAQLEAASQQVRSDIEYARQLAMTTGQTHGVQFVSGGSYTVYQGTVLSPVANPLTRQSMVITLSATYPGVTIQSP